MIIEQKGSHEGEITEHKTQKMDLKLFQISKVKPRDFL